MTEYLPEFCVFAVAHILSLISPGPDFLMVVRSSLRYSRSTALWVAFGISCGEMLHVAYSVFGLGVIISQSTFLFTILKYLGGSYLIYIGIQSLRAQKQEMNIELMESAMEKLSKAQAFRLGFLTNALNAKAAFFTLSFFTVLVSPTTPIYMQAVYALFIQISTLIWFSLVVLFLTHGSLQKGFVGIKHWIERSCGALLVLLGCKLILAKLETLTSINFS